MSNFETEIRQAPTKIRTLNCAVKLLLKIISEDLTPESRNTLIARVDNLIDDSECISKIDGEDYLDAESKE